MSQVIINSVVVGTIVDSDFGSKALFSFTGETSWKING